MCATSQTTNLICHCETCAADRGRAVSNQGIHVSVSSGVTPVMPSRLQETHTGRSSLHRLLGGIIAHPLFVHERVIVVVESASRR